MDIDSHDPAQNAKLPAALIKAITAMAHQLGMKVLAEGVESTTQLQQLQQAGCDFYQGYYFSKPLTEEQLLQWLERKAQE
ncbi:MAG: hypothetical protein RL217_1941 [Pseudomonadota bacterium]